MIRFETTVKRIEERSRIVRGYKGKDDKVVFESEKLGWFIVLTGIWEALCVGDEKPDLKVGDVVEVIIRKGSQADVTSSSTDKLE